MEKIEDKELCECKLLNEDIAENVEKDIPCEEILYDLADLFKIFSDSTRIRILFALYESEMCVCDIAVLLDMKQSAISHQLRVLRQANLVKNRRDGKEVYYSLVDNHIKEIFNQALTHVKE